MSASTGSTTPPPDAQAERPRGGILGAISAAAEEPPVAGERIIDIAVARLAPHPDNPRSELGDVSEIGASIAERGVLQPLVVVTRAALLTARPDAQLPTDAEWVVLAGHRRRAGALHAGVTTVPVVVRDELAADEDAIVSMLVENLQREDLNPLEEARAFGRLQDRGWSERQIAKAVAVSPGQVHKRLALRRLPLEVATALTTGELTVADSLRLLDLPDNQVSAAWAQSTSEPWRGVRGVVEARLAALEANNRARMLHDELTSRGFELIDDPATTFGDEWWRHILAGDDQLSADRTNAGQSRTFARVSVVGNQVNVEYFSHTPREDDRPAEPASTASTPAPAPAENAAHDHHRAAAAADEARRRRAADEQEELAAKATVAARHAACARLVTGSLPPDLASEVLADALLVGHTIKPYEAADTAFRWCQAGASADPARGDDELDGHSRIQWLTTQAAAGGLTARRAAVAVALAEVENDLASPTRRAAFWSTRETRHVRRLAAHAGYELTALDEHQLAAAATEGASSGSTPKGNPR